MSTTAATQLTLRQPTKRCPSAKIFSNNKHESYISHKNHSFCELSSRKAFTNPVKPIRRPVNEAEKDEIKFGENRHVTYSRANSWREDVGQKPSLNIFLKYSFDHSDKADELSQEKNKNNDKELIKDSSKRTSSIFRDKSFSDIFNADNHTVCNDIGNKNHSKENNYTQLPIKKSKVYHMDKNSDSIDFLDTIFPEVNFINSEENTKSVNSAKTKEMEKKVTFASGLKTNAQVRRLNFKNSRNTNILNNIKRCSTALEERKEHNHTLDRASSCDNYPPPSTTMDFDKIKQSLPKRKLKSCRGRSFHKSFESSILENPTSKQNIIPHKTTASQADIVTMVSLVNISEPEQDNKIIHVQTKQNKETVPASKPTKKYTNTAYIINKHSKERSKSSEIPPTIIRHSKSVQLETDSKIAEGKFQSVKHFENSALDLNSRASSDIRFSNENNETMIENTNVNIITQNGSDHGMVLPVNTLTATTGISLHEGKTLQDMKEKECQISFEKMTNKGISVSFDTILRGLLTPTEYRMRKDTLVPQ